jgi:lipopolysaccharide transport system ATP-binding protein
MKRIRQLKEQGVTILFVSHDCSSVKMLCQRAALLSYGKMLKIDNPKDVVNHYIALLSSVSTEKEAEAITSKTIDTGLLSNTTEREIHRHGNQFAVLNFVKLTDLDHREIKNKLETGSFFNIVVGLEAKAELSDLVIGFSIRNLMGVVIYGTNTHLMHIKLPTLSSLQKLTAVFQIPCYLNKGVYTITVGIHSEEGISYDWMDEVIILEVTNSNICDGLVDLNARILVNQFTSNIA